MKTELLILVLEAIGVYLLVLIAHAMRRSRGWASFYALIGSITAIMSWVTDAGVKVDIAGITFVVGSTVFYTSLLLAIFVAYVFDGPKAARVAITMVAGVSILVPAVSAVLHLQMKMSVHPMLEFVPVPSLRINAASVITTVADMIFLAMAWEFMGKTTRRMPLWAQCFLTLLGVMWLDVVLFSTGAFAGHPDYFNIMKGTMLSRLLISVVAGPILYLYLQWQNRQPGVAIEHRPVLTILKEMIGIRVELDQAQREIERRKIVEAEKELLIRQLEEALALVKKMEGLLPVCAGCKRIRLDPVTPNAPERWVSLEDYLHRTGTVRFSHGFCMDCMHRLYPEEAREMEAKQAESPLGEG